MIELQKGQRRDVSCSLVAVLECVRFGNVVQIRGGQIADIPTGVVECVAGCGDCGVERVFAEEPAFVGAEADSVVMDLYDIVDLEKDGLLSGRRVA